MSALNLSYEIDNGAEEISYFEDKHIKEPSQLANIIAGDIVKEILDNAFEIVSKSNTTSTNWIDSGDLNVTNFIKSECLHVVGDILEAADDKVEMRNHQNETLGPYDVVTFDTIHAKSGIGDQSFDNQTACYENEIEPENVRTIEKKSRVTDLVKNSPQIISEYLMIDEKAKQNQDKWEETEEKILQVIELNVDAVEPKPSINEDDDNAEVEVLHVPKDNDLDTIDLSSVTIKEEGNPIVNSQLAKGDQQCPNEPSSPRSNSNDVEGINTHSFIEKECHIPCECKTEENKLKKKKWNFGTKFLGFLKKNNKRQNTSISKLEKQ
ncbi:hypothetical protein FQR65_LT07079 [Abscondita terminalis]|nr:hypothetical protein FQR65_LT07079 [Abscondita terminalis]